ncbi:hypothetical protein [Rhodoferax sp.]|uniref:hypothetical protein n=1 Tax=Rhodoferax sp. TaxID=50421 RepID=UPI002751DAC5|nr:hypothetical protein [Rhodoferax sp.]
MKYHTVVRGLCLSAVLFAVPAWAQVTVRINLAPPPVQYEIAPQLEPGFAWAPGYWAWNVDRHVWIRGRTIVQRDGYRWEPDRWEQRDLAYYRHPGRWERDAGHHVIKAKKPKKAKHWNNAAGDDGPGQGKGGKGGKPGKDR